MSEPKIMTRKDTHDALFISRSGSRLSANCDSVIATVMPNTFFQVLFSPWWLNSVTGSHRSSSRGTKASPRLAPYECMMSMAYSACAADVLSDAMLPKNENMMSQALTKGKNFFHQVSVPPRAAQVYGPPATM